MRTPPGSTISHHSDENHQKLPHARHQRHLLGFAGGQEALVERPDGGVVAASDQGSHVERFSYPPPATPHTATTPQGARVPVEGGYSHQSREFPGRKRAELGKLGQKRSAQYRSDSRNAPEQGFVLLEGGALLDGFVELPVGTREFLLEPADVRFDAPSDGPGGGSAETVFLGGHHLDDLPPPGEDGLKLPRFGVGKRPGGG